MAIVLRAPFALRITILSLFYFAFSISRRQAALKQLCWCSSFKKKGKLARDRTANERGMARAALGCWKLKEKVKKEAGR